MKSKLFFAALPCLALLAGCISPVAGDGRLKHVQFDVEGSNLDWIEIVYFPAPDNDAIPFPCHLSIYGSGEIIFRTGRSPRLADSFSADVENPHWNEYLADRMHLGRDEIREVCQIFVDEGIVPKYPKIVNKQKAARPYIRVAANIGGESVRMVTDNKNLVTLTEEAMENFESTLKAAAEAAKERPEQKNEAK